jgi:hypothetical protein
MPEVATKHLQFVAESEWGTIVTAATHRFQGLTNINLDIDEGIQGSAQLGNMGAPTMMTEVYQEPAGSLDCEASYEDLMYLLHSLFGAGTKTQTTAPFTWTYPAPLQAAATPFKQSAQIGMPGFSYNVGGFLLNKLTIKGEAKGMWTASTDFIAKTALKAVQTTLADTTVNGIRMADSIFSVDTWAGTIGTTPAPITLRSFELSIDAKRHTKFFAGGLGPLSHGCQRWEVELKTTVELNAMSAGWVDAMLAPAMQQKQIQIKATSGAAAALKSATINFAGVLSGKVGPVGADADGNATMDLTWKAQYNSTLTNYLIIILQNALTALV